MTGNLTKIASLPQGGGSKAALVGEVQSVVKPEPAYAMCGKEAGPELSWPQVTINMTTMLGPSAQARINKMIALAAQHHAGRGL